MYQVGTAKRVWYTSAQLVREFYSCYVFRDTDLNWCNLTQVFIRQLLLPLQNLFFCSAFQCPPKKKKKVSRQGRNQTRQVLVTQFMPTSLVGTQKQQHGQKPEIDQRSSYCCTAQICLAHFSNSAVLLARTHYFQWYCKTTGAVHNSAVYLHHLLPSAVGLPHYCFVAGFSLEHSPIKGTRWECCADRTKWAQSLNAICGTY